MTQQPNDEIDRQMKAYAEREQQDLDEEQQAWVADWHRQDREREEKQRDIRAGVALGFGIGGIVGTFLATNVTGDPVWFTFGFPLSIAAYIWIKP